MAITREKKEQVVKELKDYFADAKVVVFTDYKGMGVNTITDLRRKVREDGGRYLVAKKSLIKLALSEDLEQKLDIAEMEGQIALAFGFEDSVATAKAVNEMAKELEMPRIIAGIMDEEVLNADSVKQLASLPTREELIAKAVGTIKAPLSGFVNVLSGNTRNLVYALNAIKESK